ncbi:MAG: type II secretion system minor pseudopilin GspJ [Chromatiales bacterium]|jgi:general secretion pathway protein J|nr:type II secretion system minor pseudopilin GspJ [Chromatiales bacterium]
MTRTRGFTLIELLVALALFAVLSAMAYGGLRAVLDARERAATNAELLSELQIAMLTIGRDVQQAINRPIRDEFGDRAMAMIGTGGQLEFTRGGWRNPAGLQRSELQRVGYLVQEGALRRLSWQTLDRAQGSEPRAAILLHDVKALGLRFLDTKNEWHEFWPPSGADPATTSALPRAIEVSVDTGHWDRITRLFQIAPGLPPQTNTGAQPSQDSSQDSSRNSPQDSSQQSSLPQSDSSIVADPPS